MKLSVIIPVYNVGEYLSQCLDSVLSQDIDDMEIICIDDCSKDNSYNILLKYAQQDSRIKVYKNEQNIGVGYTRNKGLNVATGEYVHFLDPDDWLENGAYHLITEKLNNKNLDILFVNYKKFDNETKEFRKIEFPNKDILDKILNPVKDAEVFDNWERMCWLKFIRRDFLTENNITFPNYVSLSDVEWAANTYVKAKTICYTDIVVVNYRVNRKNSLVKLANNSILQIIGSVIKNRKLYVNFPDKIKYRMLAADYILLTKGIPNAYKNGILNIFELYKIIKIVNNDKNIKKYNFSFRDDYCCYQNLKFPILDFKKVVVKTNFPELFYFIVQIKKFLK